MLGFEKGDRVYINAEKNTIAIKNRDRKAAFRCWDERKEQRIE